MVQNSGGETFTRCGDSERPGAAGHLVDVLMPQTHMYVSAVADGIGGGHRTEDGAQTVGCADGPNDLAHQDGGVGGRYRVIRCDGQFELALLIFRVDLLDDDATVAQHRQHIAEITGQLTEPGHTVCGCRGGRAKAVGVERIGPRHVPFEFDRGAQDPAVGGEFAHEAAQQQPGIPRMRHTALGVAVRGCPCPAGQCRQHGDAIEVGIQPQIAGGPAGEVVGQDRVVEEEGVEDG